MTIRTFLDSLRSQNVQLWVEGDRLRCSGPQEVLTPDLRASLAERKPEIIAYLRAAQVRAGAAAPLPSVASVSSKGRTESSTRAPGSGNPYLAGDASAADTLTAPQRQYLQAFIARYVQRTPSSKRWMQTCRPVLADYDSSAGFRRDLKEMHYLPVADRAQGTRIWDIDGNEYIDFCMGFGVNFFGHVPAFERAAIEEELQRGMALGPHWHLTGEVAQLICDLTGQERVTFVNSGTEAVMAALRIARAVTGRSKIALFAGSYHGTFDGLLVVRYLRPDGELSALPMVPGVTRHLVEDVIVLDYDNPESLQIIQDHAHELAAVLVEPVQSRKPDLQPKAFLHALRQLTAEADIALIFDEMITGFRIHPGGAQAWFGVQADLVTYGKVVGGGMPVGIVAGKARYMDVVDGGQWQYGDASSPVVATTFITGTFSRHPLCLAAMRALLMEFKQAGPALQAQLNDRTAALVQRLNEYFSDSQAPIRVVHFGSLFRFTSSEDLSLFYYHLADKGIYIGVNHNCFLSPAHTDEDVARLVTAVQASFVELCRGGFFPGATPRPAVPTQPVASPEPCTLPLTEMQQDYWLAVQLGDAAAHATAEGMFLRIRGPLQVDALRRALQKVVDRHGALRTTFDPHGEFQRIAPTLTLDVPVIDLSHLSLEEREAQVSEWMVAQSWQPFDLVNGPLVRCHLFKLAPQEHLLCPVASHLITDAWSFEVLLKELVEFYPAECQGRPAQLPEPMQYEAYVRWQESQRTSPKRATDEVFWLGQFSDSVPVVDLPTDRPRSSAVTYASGREYKRLDASLLDPLKKWSYQHGATLFMTFLTTFAVFLKRLTGQHDLVIGVPTAMRSLRGSENLIGYCLNIMPIHIRTVGDPRFSDCLVSVRRTLLQCYEHADYPFGALIRKLNPARDPSRLPLVAITFNLDRRISLPPLGELTFDLVPQPISSTQYDIVLNVLEANDELLLSCVYKTDLFDRETVQRWLENLVCLLRSVIVNPEERIAALPFLPEAERQQLLVAWNATQVDYPRDRCLHELFEAQVARTPEAVAVIFEDQILTYRELNHRANQCAHHLAGLGVGPDSLVGICVERSAEMVIGLLGILKAGGAYVPLDPTYPPERLTFMLEDAHVSWLLTQAHLVERLPAHSAHTICLDTDWPAIVQSSQALDAQQGPISNVQSRITSDNLAYMIYTSGSTGKPKGAMNTQRGLLNRLLWMQDAYHLTAEDVVLQKTPFSFDVSVWEFFWPLLVGARLVVARPEGHKDPAYLVEVIVRRGVTTLHFVPSMLQAFLAAPGVERCVSVRRVICSGEALSYDLQKRFFDRVRQAELHNLYGPTEAAVDVTHWQCRPQSEPHSVPIGQPVANTQMYILDADGQPVPIGVVGELYIGGVQVGRGYHNRPELTAERFVPNPFTPPIPSPSATAGDTREGTRLYKTGDLARYRPDGNIEFLGRIDHQVKIRGYRIELGEIETVLNQHPAVREAVVVAYDVAQEDQPYDNKRLIAYVSLEPEATATVVELRHFLQNKLPEYMVPAALVRMEALPLTPNGKIDRRALPAPGHERPELVKAFVAPRTPLEHLLAEMWAELLDVEQVGVEDNFFDLGGHSLLGTQLISKISELFTVEIPLRVVLQEPTVAGLAAVMLSDAEQRVRIEKTAEVFWRVADLSEDQVEAELAERALAPLGEVA